MDLTCQFSVVIKTKNFFSPFKLVIMSKLKRPNTDVSRSDPPVMSFNSDSVIHHDINWIIGTAKELGSFVAFYPNNY